jgi:hypothetical protein
MTKLTVKQGETIARIESDKLARKIRARRQKAAQIAAQLDRVALFDGSGSMSTIDAIGVDGLTCSRWDALNGAWKVLAPDCKGRLAAYVFGEKVTPVKGSASGEIVNLPFDGGSTRMCEALRVAGTNRHPGLRVLVVSDGYPTDGYAPGVAATLGCPVDTVYVGPTKDTSGRDLLQAIAAVTNGTFQDMSGKFDALKFLEHAKRLLRLEGET